MRHNKSGRRLGRKPDHRQHMMQNMVTSFFEQERITTTVTRAKELRKLVDKMITFGKRGDLHARRQVLRVIHDQKVVAKLFEMISPRFTERPGGYTRIIKLENRQGDNAPMAIIELVEEGFEAKKNDTPDSAKSAGDETEKSTEAVTA